MCVVVEVRSASVGVGSAVKMPKVVFVRKSAKRIRHAWNVFIDIEKHIKITKKCSRESHVLNVLLGVVDAGRVSVSVSAFKKMNP